MADTVYSVGIDPRAARMPIVSTPAIVPAFVNAPRLTAARDAVGMIESGELFCVTIDSNGFDRLLRVLDEVRA